VSNKIRVGDTFGKWTVVIPKTTNGQTEVICECGSTRQMYYYRLLEGHSRQCKNCSKLERQTFGFGTKMDEGPKIHVDLEKDQAMIDKWLEKNEVRKV